jgi:hypothetical protein
MPAATFAQFERDVAALLARDGLTGDPAGAAGLLRVLITAEGVASPSARAILADSGIRDRWNDSFATGRACAVAEWVAPWLAGSGRVLDLLAGDCLLTGRIAEAANSRITATERLDHYSRIAPHPAVDLVDHRLVESGARALRGDTVLMCAVLHHEDNPAALRDLATATEARRFVVVENCVDDDYGPDFHLLMDLFYIRCLNEFGSSCTREHRTVAQWQEFLRGFGDLVHVDTKYPVPGLPFPYQLLVFQR